MPTKHTDIFFSGPATLIAYNLIHSLPDPLEKVKRRIV